MSEPGTLSILPLTYDMDYVLQKMVGAGGITNHYGYAVEADGIHLRYRAEDFDTVQTILDAYPVSYADDVLRAQMLNEATATRWEKQQLPANFMGMPVLTDDVTIGRITAAAYLMDADPTSAQTRRWKISETVWMDFDRDTLVAMGRAIADHIQACFANEEALHTAINAAVNIDELAAIDITTGWPA